MLSPALQRDCRPAWISFLTNSNSARSSLLWVNWHQSHIHTILFPSAFHVFLLVLIYTMTTLWSSIWLFSRLPQFFFVFFFPFGVRRRWNITHSEGGHRLSAAVAVKFPGQFELHWSENASFLYFSSQLEWRDSNFIEAWKMGRHSLGIFH